jgi:hypothetical protein
MGGQDAVLAMQHDVRPPRPWRQIPGWFIFPSFVNQLPEQAADYPEQWHLGDRITAEYNGARRGTGGQCGNASILTQISPRRRLSHRFTQRILELFRERTQDLAHVTRSFSVQICGLIFFSVKSVLNACLLDFFAAPVPDGRAA